MSSLILECPGVQQTLLSETNGRRIKILWFFFFFWLNIFFFLFSFSHVVSSGKLVSRKIISLDASLVVFFFHPFRCTFLLYRDVQISSQQRIFLWWEHDKGLCEKSLPVLQLYPRAAAANCSFPAESASWEGGFFFCCRFYNFPSTQSLLRQLDRNWLGLHFSTVVTHIWHMTMHNCFLLVILSHIRPLWCNLLYLVLVATRLNELKHSIRVGIHVSNLRVSFVTTTAALNLKKIAVFPTWHAVFSPTSDVTPSTWRWLVWPPSLNPGGKQKRLTWRADARENVRPRRSWLACSSPVVTRGRTCFKCRLINIHVSSSIQWPPLPAPTTPPELLPNLLLPRVSKAVFKST